MIDSNHDSAIERAFTGDVTDPKEIADWIGSEINTIEYLPSSVLASSCNDLLKTALKSWPEEDGLDVDILENLCVDKKFVTMGRGATSYDDDEDNPATSYDVFMNMRKIAVATDYYSDDCDHDMIDLAGGIKNVMQYIPNAIAIGQKIREKFPDVLSDYKEREKHDYRAKLLIEDKFKETCGMFRFSADRVETANTLKMKR